MPAAGLGPRPTTGSRRAAVAVLVVLLALAGCGGTPRPSAVAPPRPALGGTPIKVMTWAPEGDTEVSYPGLQWVAQAFTTAVNEAGGINDHPLDVLTCDEADDENAAAACARRAVDEDVVAVLGSFSMHSAAYLPVLEAARIPYLGGVALTDRDYRSPMAYPITGGALVRAAAATVLAGERGCARTVLVRGGQAHYDGVEAVVVAALSGQDRPRPVVLRVPDDPGLDADLAAHLPGAGDCVILAAGDRGGRRLLGELERTGSRLPVLLAADLRGSSLGEYPTVAANASRVSWFPPADNAVWRHYRDAVRGGPVDVDDPVEQNTWAAYTVFVQLARQLTSVNSTSLLAVLERSGAIDTGGLVPMLSFRARFSVPGLDRAVNRTATFQTYRNALPAEARPGFRDVSAALRPSPRTR